MYAKSALAVSLLLLLKAGVTGVQGNEIDGHNHSLCVDTRVGEGHMRQAVNRSLEPVLLPSDKNHHQNWTDTGLLLCTMVRDSADIIIEWTTFHLQVDIFTMLDLFQTHIHICALRLPTVMSGHPNPSAARF